MRGFKRAGAVLIAAVALFAIPVLPALAAPPGYGHFHPRGAERGLVGAVVGLATLPIAIAAATVDALASVTYAAGYPARPAYAAPPSYYAGPYYRPPAGYYPAPRAYYAPHLYYSGRPGYYYSYARGPYRAVGSGYARR